MVGLIRAEFRKLFSTQVWFWLLFATLALTAIAVVGQLAPSDGVTGPSGIRDVFVTADVAYIAVFVLGALSVTTEFRYQTITPTVLATPSRWAVMAAKMISYLIVGAGCAVVTVALEVAMAWPWLAAKGFHVSLGDHAIPSALLGLFAVVVLMALVGMGVGALLRNQIVAVVLGLVFLLFVQTIVAVIPYVKYAWAYLPAGAMHSLILGPADDRVVNGVRVFSPVVGVLVLLVWAIVPAVIGAGITLNRDIT
ncbi:MAG: hypothetical protein FWD74_12135 [Actinomycetia bacterium]|nr:hypothetical protein [Actinomycetes bacterium]